MRKPQYRRRDRSVSFSERVITRRYEYRAYSAPRWTTNPEQSVARREVPTLTEVLSGWVGEKGTVNDVYHTKETLRYSPVDYTYGPDPRTGLRTFPRYPNIGASGTAELHLGALSINGISIIPNRPSLPGFALNWRKCYEALLDDVHGLMPAQKALAVNIAEFTQLKHLVPGIAKSLARIKSWVDRRPNARFRVRVRRPGSRKFFYRTVSIRSGRWCLRDLAQLHLAHQFGINPLIDDLADLSASYFRAKEHLNWFRTISDGQAHHVHASVSRRTTSDSTLLNTDFAKITDRVEASALGTMFATVAIRPVSIEVAQKRLFNQIIGLNVPLQIAWELVPFSFVLDWFLPVGEVLSAFEPKRFFGSLSAEIRFLSRGYSVKNEALVKRAVIRKNNVSIDDYIDYFSRRRLLTEGGASRSYTVYERTNSWPVLNLVPPKGYFGIKQAGISLALVVTRLFK